MTDARQARRWVELTGAENIIQDRSKARKIALSLLRGWRRYKKTGLCPWTDEELYDYTCFLHAFADRHAGNDDDLYHWLSNCSLAMLDSQTQDSPAQNRLCPICGRLLTMANVAKTDSGEVQVSIQGKSWCRKCMEDTRLKKIVNGSG